MSLIRIHNHLIRIHIFISMSTNLLLSFFYSVLNISSTPTAILPTKYGIAKLYGFSEGPKEHCCLAFWSIEDKDNVLCRIHSSCITWDVFHSLKCDCWEQLDTSLHMISQHWWILIYLQQEWRDIWLINKIRAYSLQDQWYDTIQANEKLWLPIDNRTYGIVKEILKNLQIDSINLITNNPHKVDSMILLWIPVNKRTPIKVNPNNHNNQYLQTKKDKMRHYL